MLLLLLLPTALKTVTCLPASVQSCSCLACKAWLGFSPLSLCPLTKTSAHEMLNHDTVARPLHLQSLLQIGKASCTHASRCL